MRRDTQLWIGGVAVVSVGIAGFVFINQKEQIDSQKQAIAQQALVAKTLKDRDAEDEKYRQQEEAIALQLRNLNAEQTKNAAKASADRDSQAASQKSAFDRQQLEGKIQELKAQQTERSRQTECMLIQMRISIAESAQDSGQTKTLKERWDANCANS